jgi:hypothetical protein
MGPAYGSAFVKYIRLLDSKSEEGKKTCGEGKFIFATDNADFRMQHPAICVNLSNLWLCY